VLVLPKRWRAHCPGWARRRLSLEFAGRLPLALITDTLGECRAQLSTSPETAMPELLERLARQRLTSSPTAVGF